MAQDRLLKDKSLQLGDQAGILKAYYALGSRLQIAAAAIGTVKLSGTGGTEKQEETIDTESEEYINMCEREQKELQRFWDSRHTKSFDYFWFWFYVY